MAEISRWKEFERQMKRSLRNNWKLYRQSRYGMVGLIILVIFGVMAIFAPFLTPYTPYFEAPSEDALRTYLYAFNVTDQINGLIVGYTQPQGPSPTAGDWIILNHGSSIEGRFIQNPQTVGEPRLLPWETKPLKFKLELSSIPGIQSDERVEKMAFLSPSTSDLQYHYSGPGQDPDWDGELVFITQRHLVIYDLYNFINNNYNRFIVEPLSFEPTWVTVDVTSSSDVMFPVRYSTVGGQIIVPERYIMVGNEHNVVLYFYYYTYSNDSYMPDAQTSFMEIFNHTYNEKIIFKPLLFYNGNLYPSDNNIAIDKNVIVIPLENKTIIYKGFDLHTYPPSALIRGVLPITPTPHIVETTLNIALTAAPTYYVRSPDYGKNPIFLPTVINNTAMIYVLNPVGDSSGHVGVYSNMIMRVGSGYITSSPTVTQSGGNFTVFISKSVSNGSMNYLYRYRGNPTRGMHLYPFSTKRGSTPSIEINAKIIHMDYIYENNQLFMVTSTNSVYLLDVHLYERAGYVSIGKFSYYNNVTKEISIFPYPPGSKLTEFMFMGGLTGTKYSPLAAAFNIYGIYYCNDTNTVGLVTLKGQSLLPLPPGHYVSGNWYILGTDDKGHDIWTWLIYGARVAFTVGILASFFSVIIGTLYGVYSGYKGGLTDTLMMRFVDIMLTLPGLPILLILAAILGPSIWNIILIIALLGWSGIARVIRAQTLSLKSRPFIDAAKVAGASDSRIMLLHIFPNVLPFTFLYMTLGVAGAIIMEASLSFLGLGDPRAISWGQMLYSIQTAGATMYAWWWLLPPGLSIALISLGFYLVGRAFDEILNPRLRKR